MNRQERTPRALLIKIATDIACLLAVAIPILVFFVAGKPYERGFFCDDESIRHPYLESTVPRWMLYVFGLGLPILTIIVTEFVIFRGTGRRTCELPIGREIPSWIWEGYNHIGVFAFGAACSQLTTDIGKYTIGRLRPHFYSVCQPDVDCSRPEYKYAYIEKFKCKAADAYLLKDMRLSFPSGHSSFSTYCMLFLVAYLQAKLRWRGSKLLKHTLQFVAISMAVYTALSRISDYKHHWSDVLAGVIQGAIVAILIVLYVSDMFPRETKTPVFGVDPDAADNGVNVMEGKESSYRNSRVI